MLSLVLVSLCPCSVNGVSLSSVSTPSVRAGVIVCGPHAVPVGHSPQQWRGGGEATLRSPAYASGAEGSLEYRVISRDGRDSSGALTNGCACRRHP